MRNLIRLNCQPSAHDLVAEYRVSPKKSVKQIALQFLEHRPQTKRLEPTIFYLDQKQKLIKIAFPKEGFEEGNAPALLSSLTGNFFGANNGIRLQDINLPLDFLHSFKGPRLGVEGIRKLTKIKTRPFLGSVALQTENHIFSSLCDGMDVIQDYDTLTKRESFESHIKQLFKQRDNAEKETGMKKLVFPNITAETMEMLRRAKIVRNYGGEFVMVDLMTTGLSGLQTLRDHWDQGIYANRSMHNEKSDIGISNLVHAKLARMIGVDCLRLGTSFLNSKETKLVECELSNHIVKEKNDVLSEAWESTPAVLPVVLGNLNEHHLPSVFQTLGNDVVALTENPQKAKIFRRAMEAALHQIPLEDYAIGHPELRMNFR